jgi:TonB family protein
MRAYISQSSSSYSPAMMLSFTSCPLISSLPHPCTGSALRSAILALAVGLALVFASCSGSKTMGEGLEMIVLDSVETQPTIIGGMNRVYELTTYPQDAQEAGAYGTVWVQTIITAGGKASSPRITQQGHRSLERVALEVVRKLEFEPARLDRAPVPATVEIPVTFPPPEPDDES